MRYIINMENKDKKEGGNLLFWSDRIGLLLFIFFLVKKKEVIKHD